LEADIIINCVMDLTAEGALNAALSDIIKQHPKKLLIFSSGGFVITNSITKKRSMALPKELKHWLKVTQLTLQKR
jgi:hypothetical protein